MEYETMWMTTRTIDENEYLKLRVCQLERDLKAAHKGLNRMRKKLNDRERIWTNEAGAYIRALQRQVEDMRKDLKTAGWKVE